MEVLKATINLISAYTIPVLFFLIVICAMHRRVKVYETFISGGKEGWDVFMKVMPYIIVILVAIGIFRRSGMLELLTDLLRPITNGLGMPGDTVGVALMKPISGSGSLGVVTEIIKRAPNSFEARTASTMYGAADTTFYILALYFGSVGIKKIRHAMIIGLLADFAGIMAAVAICRFMFPAD